MAPCYSPTVQIGMRIKEIESTNQHYMYDTMCQNLAADFIHSHSHLTLVAYGPYNSGKSYTLIGNTDEESSKGILPRLVNDVMSRLVILSLKTRTQYFYYVSFIEICNDIVIDLLSTKGGEEQTSFVLDIDELGYTHIQGVSKMACTSYDDVIQWLKFGLARRNTKIIDGHVSSLSHAVFTFHVYCVREGRLVKYNKLIFIDLTSNESENLIEESVHGYNEYYNSSYQIIYDVIANKYQLVVPNYFTAIHKYLQDAFSASLVRPMKGRNQVDVVPNQMRTIVLCCISNEPLYAADVNNCVTLLSYIYAVYSAPNGCQVTNINQMYDRHDLVDGGKDVEYTDTSPCQTLPSGYPGRIPGSETNGESPCERKVNAIETRKRSTCRPSLCIIDEETYNVSEEGERSDDNERESTEIDLEDSEEDMDEEEVEHMNDLHSEEDMDKEDVELVNDLDSEEDLDDDEVEHVNDLMVRSELDKMYAELDEKIQVLNANYLTELCDRSVEPMNKVPSAPDPHLDSVLSSCDFQRVWNDIDTNKSHMNVILLDLATASDRINELKQLLNLKNHLLKFLVNSKPLRDEVRNKLNASSVTLKAKMKKQKRELAELKNMKEKRKLETGGAHEDATASSGSSLSAGIARLKAHVEASERGLHNLEVITTMTTQSDDQIDELNENVCKWTKILSFFEKRVESETLKKEELENNLVLNLCKIRSMEETFGEERNKNQVLHDIRDLIDKLKPNHDHQHLVEANKVEKDVNEQSDKGNDGPQCDLNGNVELETESSMDTCGSASMRTSDKGGSGDKRKKKSSLSRAFSFRKSHNVPRPATPVSAEKQRSEKSTTGKKIKNFILIKSGDKHKSNDSIRGKDQMSNGSVQSSVNVHASRDDDKLSNSSLASKLCVIVENGDHRRGTGGDEKKSAEGGIGAETGGHGKEATVEVRRDTLKRELRHLVALKEEIVEKRVTLCPRKCATEPSDEKQKLFFEYDEGVETVDALIEYKANLIRSLDETAHVGNRTAHNDVQEPPGLADTSGLLGKLSQLSHEDLVFLLCKGFGRVMDLRATTGELEKLVQSLDYKLETKLASVQEMDLRFQRHLQKNQISSERHLTLLQKDYLTKLHLFFECYCTDGSAGRDGERPRSASPTGAVERNESLLLREENKFLKLRVKHLEAELRQRSEEKLGGRELVPSRGGGQVARVNQLNSFPSSWNKTITVENNKLVISRKK